ncbi:MAG: pyridoxal-phosphate dependent enzyme, partial [Anaerovorax sp.]|nr:pyridoxal-phosphate dependent enzyme [Anaerovorax sp.]
MMNLFNRTPLLEVNSFKDRSVMLKMEAYQPSGSFKLRGMDRICKQAINDGASHLVSSSGGNAGLSVAYVGRKLGVEVTVVIPKTTAGFVVSKLENEGAKVIIHGDVWDDAHQYALSLADDKNTAYIPPFDHPLLWEGHSTIIDELKGQCEKQPDLIVLSVGGGGLLCGVVEGLIRNKWTDTKVLAVETFGSASLYHAVKAGELIELESINTIAT